MDYDAFCSGLHVLDKTGHMVPFVPLPAQAWRRANRTHRDVVLKARQGGVTTEEIARSAWTFATKPDSITVMVVPGDATGSIAASAVGVFERFFPSREAMHLGGSRFVLKHENGSRILVMSEAEASPGRMPKGLRGWSIDRLHCTEVAFWDETEGHIDALAVLGDMVKDNGEVVIESSSNGPRSGRFYRMWRDAVTGTSGYKAHFAAWYVCHGLAVTPQNDKERSLLARGVSESQLLWYREKVALRGQAMVDLEYPSDPEDCFR